MRDGCLLPLAEIDSFVAVQPDSVVVIDEAYVDFGGASAIPLTTSTEPAGGADTVQVALAAGLRVRLRRRPCGSDRGAGARQEQFQFLSAGPAGDCRCGSAYEDREYFEKTCRAVIASRAKLTAELQTLGFEVLPSAANFLFTRLPRHDAQELALALRQRSIIVRHFKLHASSSFCELPLAPTGSARRWSRHCGNTEEALTRAAGFDSEQPPSDSGRMKKSP